MSFTRGGIAAVLALLSALGMGARCSPTWCPPRWLWTPFKSAARLRTTPQCPLQAKATVGTPSISPAGMPPPVLLASRFQQPLAQTFPRHGHRPTSVLKLAERTTFPSPTSRTPSTSVPHRRPSWSLQAAATPLTWLALRASDMLCSPRGRTRSRSTPSPPTARWKALPPLPRRSRQVWRVIRPGAWNSSSPHPKTRPPRAASTPPVRPANFLQDHSSRLRDSGNHQQWSVHLGSDAQGKLGTENRAGSVHHHGRQVRSLGGLVLEPALDHQGRNLGRNAHRYEQLRPTADVNDHQGAQSRHARAATPTTPPTTTPVGEPTVAPTTPPLANARFPAVLANSSGSSTRRKLRLDLATVDNAPVQNVQVRLRAYTFLVDNATVSPPMGWDCRNPEAGVAGEQQCLTAAWDGSMTAFEISAPDRVLVGIYQLDVRVTADGD